MAGPPESLVCALVAGGVLAGLEWHETVSSTQTRAADAARRGVDEIYAVLADEQTAGRGRQGRNWHAPPGTSLLCSLVVRPQVPLASLGLLPLLTGLALADAVDAVCPGLDTALKWPNDLLVGGRKAAGVLIEAQGSGAVIVGVGVNVDWRGVSCPSELANAISLVEAAGAPVSRWDLLAALARSFQTRYVTWPAQPTAFLDAYRSRCATIGASVRVTLVRGETLAGRGADIARDGALILGLPDGATTKVTAGDVEHAYPAATGW